MRLFVTSVLLAVALAVSGATVHKRQAATSIDTLFKKHGKVFFGIAADQARLSVSQDAAISAADFGGWDTIEASRGAFNFAGADFLVNWAVTNGKKIRGHTFVWAQQLPAWVTAINDAPTLTTVLQNHITQVMTHYKGKLYAVDVVNEHINEDGTVKSTHWTQVLGNNVFTIAFQAARAVDPNVKLYINDYNLDSNNAKVQGIIKLVKSINANGKLVDGIGTQGHLGAGGAGGMQAALVALASAGVDVAITELDIANAAVGDYDTVVNACLAVPPASPLPSGVPAYNGIVSILNAGGTTAPPTSTTSTPISTISTSPPTTTVSTPSSTPTGVSQHWDQCGGMGWTGATVCASPFTCQELNAWYFQCL
ncbi:glycoside hydrolase superfamily [Mycena leptocephala]|nr:glycoside hydrolase superfamily [Mycena leptocephala]